MSVRNDGIRRRAPERVEHRPAAARAPEQPRDERPTHLVRPAWSDRHGASTTADEPGPRVGSPAFRGRVGAGLAGRGSVSPTPSSGMATPNPAKIDVTSQNYELLRRLDLDGDGVLRHGEVVTAMQNAGGTRIANEGRDLTTRDRNLVLGVRLTDGAEVQLRYRGTGDIRPIGIGAGRMRWNDVRSQLFAEAAGQRATPGRIGQGRVGDPTNNDCGPASALYIHHNHELAAGRTPNLTHAQADARIRALSLGRGTSAPQMVNLLNDNFRSSGGRSFTYGQHAVTRQNLPTELMAGIRSDPGGVMVPVVATHNPTSATGTPHWLVVTGFTPDGVRYYDPSGPDGAQHERTMPMSELQDMLQEGSPAEPTHIVYGASVR